MVLGISFLTALRVEVVSKPVILGTLTLISVILLWYWVFKTNPLVSMALTVVTNLSYSVCLTTPLSTTLFSLLKSTGQFLIY